MSHAVTVFLFTVGLFFGMLLFLEIGRRIGIRRMKEDGGTAGEGVGAVDGAVFALLGLLIAFTFSGASARFDTRRQLIVEETNDIGTAYLRLDLLAADAQAALVAGYGMTGSKLRSWIHMFCFALAMAVAVYVILDIEYPRLGLIRVDAFDQALVDLRESMNRDIQNPGQK